VPPLGFAQIARVVREDSREPGFERARRVERRRALDRGDESRLDEVLSCREVAGEVHAETQEPRRECVEDEAERLGVAVATEAIEQLLG
jgi:hypothetical protein